MEPTTHARIERPARLLTFASGGWVLLLTAVLAVVIIAMTVVPAVRRHLDRPPGDGVDPATYGFDLSACLVDRDLLVAGQLHRDMIPPLVDPPVMEGQYVDAFNAEQRGKYLVPADRVIGVDLGGEQRAYPLSILNLHEVANDRLGGRAIAVTYSPLCDSVIVVDRTVEGPDGAETLEFGVSGLLYNSNLLLYDRRSDPAGESLWVQLEQRAVTGPAAAAGRRLAMIPAVVTHWGTWLEAHPETTVLEPNPDLVRRYKETSYDGYFRSARMLFPVRPAPPADGPAPKTACVVVLEGNAPRVYPLPYVAARADEAGRWVDEVDGTRLSFRYREDPAAVTVTRLPGGEPARVVYSLWFAWHAMSPASALAGDAGSP